MIHIKFPSLDFDLQRLLKKWGGKVKFRETALVIGKEFVDLVELRRTLSGPRLVNFVSTPITTKPVVSIPSEESATFTPLEETMSQHEQILSAVRQALRESGKGGRKVVSALSEEEVVVRYFQMPRLPKKDWDQAVRFEARKYIPFTLEELISDFSVIEDKKEKGKMDVVFVAAKKEVISRHLALFTKSNLQVTHLETLSISSIRLLYTLLGPAAKKERCLCVVDIDGNSGSITLVKEGLPYLVRRVSLETMPSQEIPSPDRPPQEASSLSPMVEKLLDEIRLTARYYRNQFPGESISKVFLFGEGLTSEMVELLERELNLPVAMGDLSRIVASGEVVPLRLARAVGLGLRGLTEGGPEIELLPPKEATGSSKQAKFFKTVVTEAVAVVIVLIAISSILSHHITLQRKKLADEAGKNAPRVSSLSREELKKGKEALLGKISFYDGLLNRRIFWTPKLNQLGNVLPKGAWVTNLVLEDYSEETSPSDGIIYRFSLRGLVYAPDKTEELKVPTQFLSALQQNEEFFEGFTEGKVISVKRDVVEGVGVTSFEILLTGRKGN